MVSKLLLAFSLPLATAWAQERYLGLAGRGLLVGRASGCPANAPQSCQSAAPQGDRCCFESPGVSPFLRSGETVRDVEYQMIVHRG